MDGDHLHLLELAAGANGIFTPYIIGTLDAGSQAASTGLSVAGFVIGVLATVFNFSRSSTAATTAAVCRGASGDGAGAGLVA